MLQLFLALLFVLHPSLALLFVLQLFLFRTIRLDAADFTQCASHGSFTHRWQETLYNMFHFVTLYVVPLLLLSCCYSRILLHINQQHLQHKGTPVGYLSSTCSTTRHQVSSL